ncbi:MAG: hypothetical protein K2J58_04120 [Muribaculaceae bacterium]|nr:hypothetical protein [Muribaculaceae bacterium]
MTLKRFLLHTLVFIFCFSAAAQDRYAMMQKSDSILSLFENRFSLLDSLIFGRNNPHSDVTSDIFIQASRKYGDTLLADSLYNDALEKSVRTQAKAIKSPTGLQITGQTYYRLDGQLGFNEEDDAVSRYNTKFQAEARWNFFNSGLWNTKGKIREVAIQADIDRIAYQKETRGTEYARQREFYRSMQDSAMCRILSHRVQNLSLLSDAYMFLLNFENISSDDIMLILSEKAEAERKLVGLTVRNLEASDLSHPDAFIVRLDTASFLSYVNENQADFKIARKRQELFEQRAKNAKYWDDVDCSPFLRYSYYTRSFLSNSANVDAGIYFKFPINNVAAKQRAAFRAQGEAIAAEQYLRKRQIADEVVYVATEVERLNNSIIGEYNRSLELKRYLDMRKYAYENRLGEYNRLARMKEYNAYLLCLERLLEFQYSRDQQIASLAKFLAGENVSDFCSIEKLSADRK